MPFSCQTSRFAHITLGTVCSTHFSGVLTSYLTLVLYTPLKGAEGSSPTRITQIGAPKLKLCPKQPGLLYVQNKTRNWLEHNPTLSEFLGHIESEFEGTYFRMFISP